MSYFLGACCKYLCINKIAGLFCAEKQVLHCFSVEIVSTFDFGNFATNSNFSCMKQLFLTLVLFSFWAAAPAFGQGTTKLLTAQTQLSLDIGTGQPTLGDSTIYTYNSAQRIIQTTYWHYNADSVDWQLFGRLTDYSYDLNGNLLTKTEQRWDDGTNSWSNYARTTNTFDGNNLQLTSVQDTTAGTGWAVESTRNWTYDGNGNVLTETTEHGRYTYVYNIEDLVESVTQDTMYSGNWGPFFRTLYTYVPADTKIATITTEQWDTIVWIGYDRTTYTYDANADAVVTLSENWINGAWEKVGNLLSDYDTNHNLIHWVSQYWTGASWEDFLQMVAEYDADNDISKARWEYNLGVWQPLSLFGFYYTEFVSTNAPLLADFQIIPNPTSSVVVLKSKGLTRVQIFDNQGQLMHSQQLSGQAEETLRVGELPAGNYFLQVTSSDGKIGAKPLQIRH